MDALDCSIIRELQDNFPLAEQPYAVMAQRLGISADLLWQRVQALTASGVIRRMGFSIDSRKLGYVSTLAAMRLPVERIEEAAALMADIPEITHSYVREDAFNLWFTVIASAEGHIEAILERLRQQLNLSADDLMDLPAEKFFKLDVRFKP